MRCPKCKDEYENEYKVCADCNVELIEDHEEIGEFIENTDNELLQKLPFADILQNSNFKIQTENDYFIASHENLPEICIIPFEEGFIFEIWQPAGNSEVDYSLINQLNNDTMSLRTIFNQQENMFVMDSCFFGAYTQQDFASFFNLFLNEIRKTLSNDLFKINL